MSAPDPESFSLAGKVVAALTVVGAPIGWLWTKLDGKLSKGDFKEFCKRFDTHCENDREVQAKLFDQVRENEQRAQDRYERLMERLGK
jgi:hypothetical protein